MQHDTTDAARSIKRGGAFRHFASLSEMHIRGTRNDESLASWPSTNPKADASAQVSGDHQYATDAVARKPAARHGPAQGPSRLDVLGQGGQTTRFHQTATCRASRPRNCHPCARPVSCTRRRPCAAGKWPSVNADPNELSEGRPTSKPSRGTATFSARAIPAA